MFMRVDQLQAELPAPTKKDPNAAAALQELLGGKYGEMSTLGNYMFQSFNFRSKDKLKPFYHLVASITAEELGHLELVSNGVAMLNNGPDNHGDEGDGGDVSDAPFELMTNIRLELGKVLREFLQGKRGPEGLAMANLQFDGPIPPGLFEAKSSQTFAEFGAEYAAIASALRRSSRMSCIPAVAAMLMLPEFHSNNFRLEVLAHLAVMHADGRRPITASQLSAWFNQLDHGTCGRREDPAEDLFIANAMYGGGNHRLFEGTAEGNARACRGQHHSRRRRTGSLRQSAHVSGLHNWPATGCKLLAAIPLSVCPGTS
jgi:hypothetical protein